MFGRNSPLETKENDEVFGTRRDNAGPPFAITVIYNNET
jgi:hypothetical protein